MIKNPDTPITIGGRIVPVTVSGMKLLEADTHVRFCGIFDTGLGHKSADILLGTMQAFGVMEILVRKGWIDTQFRGIVRGLINKPIIAEIGDGVYSVDYTIGIPVKGKK